MDQSERRTGRGGGGIQTAGETFDELGLATSKLAGQRQYIAGFDVSRELAAERFGFLRAIGNECSHASGVEG